MKKQVAAFIQSLGGTASYAGNTDNGNQKTMFITDPKKGQQIQSIESAAYNKFGFDLGFKLQTN